MVKSSFKNKGYESIINLAKSNGYEFYQAKDLHKKSISGTPVLLLRHDLDLDLDAGLKMAEIEARLSIKSTYFILLFNNFYNPL